jgi:glycine/serine hydroxymethyltransferase
MRDVGELIVQAINGREDEAAKDGLRGRIRDICGRFPVPGLTEA